MSDNGECFAFPIRPRVVIAVAGNRFLIAANETTKPYRVTADASFGGYVSINFVAHWILPSILAW